jgi:hypothetical protein
LADTAFYGKEEINMDKKQEGEVDEYTPELPDGADTLTAEMVKLPEGFVGHVVIPEGVRKIEASFWHKPITAVSLPKSLREIGVCVFRGCRLKELRIEGDGKVIIKDGAFIDNQELTAITLGDCELGICVFMGCPVSRITLTGECIYFEEDFYNRRFGCLFVDRYTDIFFGMVRDKYGGGLGTYVLKGKLVKVNYKPDKDFEGCAVRCGDTRCYTLAGFEDDRDKKPVFEWEKIE